MAAAAAALRSRLPSRLRQLFSSEGSLGSLGASIQLDSEPPPKVKAFVDKVIQSPLQDIAIPLSGFRWEYNKGNFHHWRPLFHHFNTYFKTYLSYRNDLLLTDTITEDDPFPKHSVIQILRVMQIILENCHNKSSFDGLEHFKLLLTSTDPEVVLATLETLSALVKIHPSKMHVSGKLIGLGSINSCLLSLAQGWGTKEEGLGLYSCVVANEKSQEDCLSLFPSDVQESEEKSQYRLGSTLYFEVHGVTPHRIGESSSSVGPSSPTVIHMPELNSRKEEDLLLMKQCIDLYNIPVEQRFSLLTRIRYAHAFRSPKTCGLYSRICLLSFIVLVQSNDANDELVSFFANEPEYTNELIKIVRSEESVSGIVITLAMLALGAQLAAYSASHERARILSGSSINFSGGNRMILLNVLQKAIMSLGNSSDPSSLAFVEALLQFYLLHVISSSTSGSVMRGSGMVPTFLPLLTDSVPAHMHLVCYAVRTLQKLMDYSNAAVTLFKDLGGVELLAQRLQIEVQRVINVSAPNDDAMNIAECSLPGDEYLYIQKRLIRALLKALGSATYAPANTGRLQSSLDNALPVTLSLIFGNVEKFGGDIYCSAVTVMSEILHKDPTCFPALQELGLPDAFLSSVVSGLIPSSKALTCVPSGLGAICLNTKGFEAVKETAALRFLVNIFTLKKYTIAMNEAIVPLANAIEELLRHVTLLRSTGVDVIIEIINKVASLGEGSSTIPSDVSENTTVEMDIEDRGSERHPAPVLLTDSSLHAISDEQFIHLSTFHVMVLVHRAIENSETCRLFVERSGIDALLKLLLRPSIVQSSEGMAIALHSTMVFKGFTQHHSAPLARAYSSSLQNHLKKALSGFSAHSGTFLLDPRGEPDGGVSSSLFLVEFLLFLAASKDSRWINALLTEFGGDGKYVLEDIGRVHREVLWQISLLEDLKIENEGDPTVSSPDSQQQGSGSDEQRISSFRQLRDPLLRRRVPGWSVESQFFDLINLYRDLGRAAAIQPRRSLDVPAPGLQLGASHQSDQSVDSDAIAGHNREEEKQRTYYKSRVDMMRSIMLHITHLFQELGKAMVLPSRRRDDTVTLSPSSKSVVSCFSSITLGHMNSGGHANASGEASVSSKCRYYGKVIDFIDGILMDRHDSCNPVLLNIMYGEGVIQSVLNTFEATSQLLFAVNRASASPMETDVGNSKEDEQDNGEHSWIYGPLASYCKLLDHLVTSSYILSPFTKHLLMQPLTNGGIPFPRDAETFVKALQSMVLKAVLPVWTHPQFVFCSHNFITGVISIIRHIYSGVEVKNVSSSSTRTSGPPPNETAISTIVEMGFSRSRAEEALRQVGANSVELAMDWLFLHPEEVQEDDELARALALSLGNSGSDTKEDNSNEAIQQFEVEMAQLPPIDELLSTCMKLLQMKESLAFPVRDLLIMMCSQNGGESRSNVITFIVDQLKFCSSVTDYGSSSLLSAMFHVIALILHEDAASREVILKSGFAELATDLLWQCDLGSSDGMKPHVLKWVTAAFLALERLLQVEQKLNSEIVDFLKKNAERQTSIVIDEDKQSKPQLPDESIGQNMDFDQKKRLIQIACNCIRKQLPSDTMHAVLLLCATLTKSNPVAVAFLDSGGVPALLNLPRDSLFTGFDNIAAAIILHILEDPQTLQQAMESEIKHSVVVAANRHSSGRLTPRNFLLNLSSAISRDPVVFIRAAQSVCQVEMIGDRPYIVLVKDREKDKVKDKEKEKDKGTEKEKGQSTDAKLILGSAQGKNQDSSGKQPKAHRKPAPSFVNVIEHLLDWIMNFEPSIKDDAASDSQSAVDMDIDIAASKGKGKAVAVLTDETEAQGQDASTLLANAVFILKLLTEILMTYAASIQILLRRDTDMSSWKDSSLRNLSGGLFHHLLHKLVPYSRISKEDRVEGDLKHKLASKASQFLVASCVRSGEAKRRVFAEINSVFENFVGSADGSKSPSSVIQSFVDLLNDVLGARSPTGSYISAEASAAFIEMGLVKSLTRILQVLDLDNADSTKVVTGLIKALELVTKEHAQSADTSSGKGDSSMKPSDHNINERNDDGHSLEAVSQDNNGSVINQTETFLTIQSFGGSEAVTDDMELDQDLDDGFAPNNDDYMHDNADDARGLGDSLDAVEIRFGLQSDGQENIDEDDNDMSGDDGEEDDDDDEDEEDDDDDEQNDLEEDEDHHLGHPDTDQDDHEMDEDEFDEEVLEEDEEEEEDDEDGVILRLEEGINGINVFDHIEVFGRDHGFSSETLHVMPVEVFGSRRQGRSTSIYSLLGRNADDTVPPQHPLLVDSHSSGSSAPSRASENTRDALFSDRTLESASSRLDSISRSLRNGRQGQRFGLWMDDNRQSTSSNTSSVPQGLEDFLVAQLRGHDAEKPSEENLTVNAQSDGDAGHLPEVEGTIRQDNPSRDSAANENGSAPTSSPVTGNHFSNTGNIQGAELSNIESHSVDMQFDQNDAAARDVEAVSQESGGSGATLGESLRSLDVEIGSADGHDDGGDRQGSADRMPVGDLQGARTRRVSVSFGTSTPVNGRESSLHSVSEIAENANQEDDHGAPAEGQQIHEDTGSGSIDPAFLDALPEELRAEVLSSQQGQAAQPTNAEQQNSEDIDPEFLAALPPDIRAEVLAQQQAQRLHQSQELEGQPVEMDTVSIIATFPSDLREEVLLTSSDAVLANLTPALVAEANMLRERFAHRYHNRALFGMYPRSRRGESSRRGEGSSLDRAGGSVVSRRSVNNKLLEAGGPPLVDTDALKGMIRLLRVVQPLYKGQLQRLLLNLCAHSETRTAMVDILMEMLMLDSSKPANQDGTKPSYRLYACQSHVMYSRPLSFDGVPPLVSRRVLETLTFLARHHPVVAKILLDFRLPKQSQTQSEDSEMAHGKAPMMVEDQDESSSQHHEGKVSIALLLQLLHQPLYLRSIAHLEQLLNLLEVIIDNAINKSATSNEPGPSPNDPQPEPSLNDPQPEPSPNDPQSEPTAESVSEMNSERVTTSKMDFKADESVQPSTSGAGESDAQSILLGLPHAELRLLCSLLAKEGLSDHAYTLVAEVMKKLVAIAPSHCQLFITELSNSVQKLTKSALKELLIYGEVEKALLRSTSDGAAILRVLQALSSLVSSLRQKEKDQQNLPEEYNTALSLVRDITASLEPLWLELSSCISRVENYSDSVSDQPSSSTSTRPKPSSAMPPLPAGTQNILPYIESFFVTCEKIHTGQPGTSQDFAVAASPDVDDASASAGKQKAASLASKADERNAAFVKFSEKHRKLLNAFIRQNPGLLEKSFSLMLKVPRFIDFDNKRAHFRSKIKHQHEHHHSPLRISLRRAYILEDSYYQLRMRTSHELKGRLTVHFQGEEGIDAGGLTREWYQLLSRVIFDKGALLFTTVGNDMTFQPNPNSVYQTEHLSYFKFVGRVVGKALFDGQLLDVHFTRSFYKHILGMKVTYHDIEAIDPDYYKNLKWMLENDISDVLDLTFSIDADEEKLILYERNEVTDYELIPGGRNIKVTEENKHQYVDLVVEHRLTTAIRPQINAFMEGFNELISRDLITIFNDKELELLISGLPDIDLDDMRTNTDYSGYSPASPVIQWFWEVVQGFSKEDKARLLQFVTGTSKVPLEGFSALQGISGSQKFQIHKAYGSPDHLPSAHTCFNQLDLPEYPSKQHLEERLLLAIHEGSEGFGFG